MLGKNQRLHVTRHQPNETVSSGRNIWGTSCYNSQKEQRQYQPRDTSNANDGMHQSENDNDANSLSELPTDVTSEISTAISIR
jgi:hypothetical protein